MAKTALDRRTTSLTRTAEQRRQERIRALLLTGREEKVLKAMADRMVKIIESETSRDADAINAVRWMYEQIGPAVEPATDKGEGEQARKLLLVERVEVVDADRDEPLALPE